MKLSLWLITVEMYFAAADEFLGLTFPLTKLWIFLLLIGFRNLELSKAHTYLASCCWFIKILLSCCGGYFPYSNVQQALWCSCKFQELFTSLWQSIWITWIWLSSFSIPLEYNWDLHCSSGWSPVNRLSSVAIIPLCVEVTHQRCITLKLLWNHKYDAASPSVIFTAVHEKSLDVVWIEKAPFYSIEWIYGFTDLSFSR